MSYPRERGGVNSYALGRWRDGGGYFLNVQNECVRTNDPALAGIIVFCVGIAMVPVFPTRHAMVADASLKSTTAMGVVITFGFIGLALSSPLFGAIAGGDPTALKTGLLVLPVASLIMILVNLALRPLLARAHERRELVES